MNKQKILDAIAEIRLKCSDIEVYLEKENPSIDYSKVVVDLRQSTPVFLNSLKATMDKAKITQARNLLNEVLNAPPPSVELPPEDQCVWKNGNLWKPFSDTTNTLVVLLREDWEPLNVEAMLTTGEWELLTYAGRANGNRTHWRGSLPGGKGYKNGPGNGGVRVWFSEQSYIRIYLPGKSKERYE